MTGTVPDLVRSTHERTKLPSTHIHQRSREIQNAGLLPLARGSAYARATPRDLMNLLFALSAALTKAVVDELDDGIFTIFTTWHLYGLVVIGYGSMTLNQMALNTGALAPAVATSMAFDPITSVVLGVVLLGESLNVGALDVAVSLLALAAAGVGMAVLSRQQSEFNPGPGPAEKEPEVSPT